MRCTCSGTTCEATRPGPFRHDLMDRIGTTAAADTPRRQELTRPVTNLWDRFPFPSAHIRLPRPPAAGQITGRKPTPHPCLFCTDQPAGAGGELVFGQDPDAADIDAVDRDCTVIRPHAGHLIFFDGRKHPHYTRPLSSDSDVRVVAVMNFYTESCPESTRPPELNRHLFGDG